MFHITNVVLKKKTPDAVASKFLFGNFMKDPDLVKKYQDFINSLLNRRLYTSVKDPSINFVQEKSCKTSCNSSGFTNFSYFTCACVFNVDFPEDDNYKNMKFKSTPSQISYHQQRISPSA